MARPAADLEAAAELGKRARKARDQWVATHGSMSDGRMAAASFRATGIYTTHNAFKKLWAGEMDPHTVGIETILAIARFLEVDPDEFGPVIAERRRQVVALASGEAALAGAGAGGRSVGLHHEPAALGAGLQCTHGGSGMLGASAGVVQWQNISFPS